ncbi:16S rRNA (cytidine(1402)-2'-O)-methyltransferase [hydrothermal vent metagenome]|uniref:16S rRNA (Cytidine(1402)-2'-O)-methyltransferase n=1 Tax=hydrothermal vent metagenome TaxID=652676 RepID=A0A3B0U7M0_9ZZZZ
MSSKQQISERKNPPESKKHGFVIYGTRFEAPQLAPGLYVVATPIGNLGDITLRALQTLAGADLVLCEDTRMSARLFAHYAITTPKTALHEHNERAKIASIIGQLSEGKSICLISDAGTPLISDPGFPLVRAAQQEGLPVFALPGASALLAALMVAGLPTDRFGFIGFLPAKAMARKKALGELAATTQTLVFYESARRLPAAINAMREIFGAEREAVLGLELTKKFERTIRGTLGQLEEKLLETPPRGEAVIVVGGAEHETADNSEIWQAALALALKTQPLRTAVDEIAAIYQLRRKQVYDAALKLKS